MSPRMFAGMGDVLMLWAGKSAMLRWAAKVATHAVATSGRGATAAGLMASAVKDAATGSWGLEAGAFVLADGGLCCLARAPSCSRQLKCTCRTTALAHQTGGPLPLRSCATTAAVSSTFAAVY